MEKRMMEERIKESTHRFWSALHERRDARLGLSHRVNLNSFSRHTLEK